MKKQMPTLIRPTGFILLTFLALSTSLVAQDARFSQFNQNPLHLNPALTGLFDGGLRLTLNYRSQFYSVLSDDEYITYSGSVENRFRVGQSYASFGALVLQDEVGASDFKRSYYNMSGAYHQRLQKGNSVVPDMFLSLGFQLGMGQYSFDPNSLWFSNQYNTTLLEIDRSLDSGEPAIREGSNRFVDFNAGLLYYYAHENGASFYIGGAIHHLSEPSVGFLVDSEEKLLWRNTIHAGGALVAGEFTILPSAMFQLQGPVQSIVVGSSLRLEVNDEKQINMRAGAYLHTGKRFDNTYQPESIILSSIFELKGWQLGLSYDVTVSSLNRSNFARGAFEFSLIKTTPAKYSSRVKCPVL